MTYTVYADCLDEVKKNLDALARKAQRYSVPFSYTVGEEHPQIVRVWAKDPVTHTECAVDRYTVAAVDITIDADALVKKDGWTVCAHIEHGDVGNIVTALNGESANPEWFHAPARCDHCNSARYRKVTYMCRHESGEIKQVGSACLKEYTGINPSVALLWAEIVDVDAEVKDCAPEDWERTPRTVMYDVETVIGLAVDEIERHGYRKSVEPKSTKHEVTKALKERETPSESGAAKATAIVEWLKEVDKEWDNIRTEQSKLWKAADKAEAEGDDFEHDRLIREYWRLERTLPGDVERNGSMIAASQYCKEKHVGTLAYMPLAYDRYMERKAKEAERKAKDAASDYVGKVKERITIQAMTAKLVTSCETYYGVSYLYKFVDEKGNVFVWWASKKIQISDGMTLKGTVKDHSEYNGVKQTVITRCAVA